MKTKPKKLPPTDHDFLSINFSDPMEGTAWIKGIAHLIQYYNPGGSFPEEMGHVGWLLGEIVDGMNDVLEDYARSERAA